MRAIGIIAVRSGKRTAIGSEDMRSNPTSKILYTPNQWPANLRVGRNNHQNVRAVGDNEFIAGRLSLKYPDKTHVGE